MVLSCLPFFTTAPSRYGVPRRSRMSSRLVWPITSASSDCRVKSEPAQPATRSESVSARYAMRRAVMVIPLVMTSGDRWSASPRLLSVRHPAGESARVLTRAGRGSAPVAVAAGARVLVELAAQVQALEYELERRGGAGGVTRAELLQRRLERPHLGDLAHVLRRRHRVGDVDPEAALEGGHHRVELAGREAAVEDVEHGFLDELAEHLVLAAVAERLELDLAAGRRDDGAEVAHARRHLALVEADGALERVREQILPVAD